MEKKNEVQKTKNPKDIVSWEAEEYIQRKRGVGWYVGFIIVVAGLITLSVFLQWWSFTALIALSAVALVIYVKRPPRKLKYSLSSKGLTEGSKLYKYEDYKSFGVYQEDGEMYAIMLTPRKRFSPRVTVYFPQESGEEIVDAFGMRLPMEEVRLDFLDDIVQMLRI